MTTLTTLLLNATAQLEQSSGWDHDRDHEGHPDVDRRRAKMLNIATYVGSSICLVGILMTLLGYIGYRKFHFKRPHIIIVNLCVCLFFYYFSYIISNSHRQHGYLNPKHATDHGLCLFGAIACHFAVLATWCWITVYWIMLLVMFQRPMGGHVSHFFIKAAGPAYGIPLATTIVCGVVAHTNGDIENSNSHKIRDENGFSVGYYGTQCFLANKYLYLGCILPFCLLFLPMIGIFVVVIKGMCSDTERSKTSKSYQNTKQHCIRLTIITVLFATVVFSSLFVPSMEYYDEASFASVILFSTVSSLLGLALMILFCLHQEEIRSHWLSVIRGERATLRHQSLNRRSYDTNMSSGRKSSAVGHPSLYIENYDDERKSSTIRIVAKEDTDMSTLGLIQIPGTPSPSRLLNDVNGDKSSGESTKNKNRGSSPKHNDDETEPLTPKDNDDAFDDLKDKHETSTWKSKRKTKASRSTSTPPTSPHKKSAKRQQSVDDAGKPTNSRNANSQTSERKRPKRSNSASRMVARFKRRSTSTTEDTAQLT